MNQAQAGSNNDFAQAQAYALAGRMHEAEAAYRAILAANPGYHPAYQELGLLAFHAGQLSLAAELFRTALSLDANVALYYRNYGEICRRLGRFDEAVAAAARACALAPADIDAHFNLALACTDAHAPAAADAYRKAQALVDREINAGRGLPRLWNMRGVIMRRLGLLADARSSFEQALRLQPDFPVALNALGSLLIDTGEPRLALACFARALELTPDFAEARLNLGMAQLKLGDWQAGWENYEARWTGSAESGNGTFARAPCPLPQWNGRGETGGQGLLVVVEQGYGDTFQFSRFLHAAVQRFAKVGLVCPVAPTNRLMDWSFADRVVVLHRMPQDFATWHWQCPLMSLPRALQIRPNTVPVDIPYLKVPAAAQSHWRSRLAHRAPGRFKIGVAWAGRKTHIYDANRSLRFAQLLPLLGVSGKRQLTWVSLQKREPNEARPSVPEGVDWVDWTEELIDFADTAALVASLDLVISIDSAMVHLAGGLGRPVWMLNRYDSEWRWMEQREDSPWYPALRIFNQPAYQDWDSVLEAVRNALTAICRS